MNETNGQPGVIQFIRTVYSTGELHELQQYAKQAGARIIRTDTLEEGNGISVLLENDLNNRQF